MNHFSYTINAGNNGNFGNLAAAAQNNFMSFSTASGSNQLSASSMNNIQAAASSCSFADYNRSIEMPRDLSSSIGSPIITPKELAIFLSAILGKLPHTTTTMVVSMRNVFNSFVLV